MNGSAASRRLGLHGTAGGTNNTKNALLNFDTAVSSNMTQQVGVGSIHLTALDSITLSGAGAVAIGYTAATLALGNTALNGSSVNSVANANSAINAVDAALTSVSSLRSSLGGRLLAFGRRNDGRYLRARYAGEKHERHNNGAVDCSIHLASCDPAPSRRTRARSRWGQSPGEWIRRTL